MTVAFIAYGPVDQRSGGFLYDSHLISRLEKRGHRVQIVSQSGGGVIRRILENGRLIIRSLEQVQADLILADELNHPSLFLSMAGIRRLGCPVVAVVHHLKSREQLPAGSRHLFGMMERRFLDRVDACLFNSEETAGSVARLLGGTPRKSCVVHPGADNPLREPRIRSGPMRVLFVGNIIPRKGLDRLLSALGSLNGGNWELDVVGDETTDPEYSRLCRKIVEKAEFSKCVRFHGRVGERELDKLRETCEVLAVPSDYEGFGIVYLEAMRSGMVAVAAGDGGARNLIRDGVDGFLVSGNKLDSLESILGRLESNPDLRLKLARSAHRRGKDFPDWGGAMNKAVDFLEEVQTCR